jgi:hypothetical protein
VPGETDFGRPLPAQLKALPAQPAYVVRGGEQVYTQPIELRDVRLYSFLLESDLSALQNLCDRHLQPAAPDQVRYCPLVPRVVLGIADISQIRSTLPPDSGYGWLSEIDVAFWMLVAKLQRVGPIWVLKELAWYQPYLFVDHPWAIAAGREIYGFAKEAAGCRILPNSSAPTSFTVDAPVIDRFDPTSQVQNKRVLEVAPAGGQAVELSLPALDAPTAFRRFVHDFIGNDGLVSHPHLAQPISVFDHLGLNELPLIFLKQFRDASDGSRACYQSLIRANARMTELQSAGILAGAYNVVVNQFASHPIRDDLGLPSSNLQARAAWFLRFSCIMEAGSEVRRG